MFALMPCGFLHLLDLLAKMADQRLQAFPSHRGNREHVEPLLAAVGLEVLPRFTTLAGGVKLGGCDRVRKVFNAFTGSSAAPSEMSIKCRRYEVRSRCRRN